MTSYLDHAATTPMGRRALEAMVAELGRTGNASSLHGAGRAARRVVEESREVVAARLGARPSEVVLTSGGTEADNLAVKGLFWARSAADPRRRRVLVSGGEHHAVLDPAVWLGGEGAEVVLLPVDGCGRLDLDALSAELDEHGDEVALLSVMWANNEVGTVQPVEQVVALARAHGVPVHCDAVQAVGQLPVDFAASGLDAMTVSAHKVGGPVGVGALLARRGLDLTPVLHGGGQERGVRSGTLDVPSVRAFAVALEEAVDLQPTESVRLAVLRDRLVQGIRERVEGAVLRGPEVLGATPEDGRTAARLPANAHLTFNGCEGDSLLYLLDSRGVQCSTGSACRAGVPQPSHVLLAMGVEPLDARGALRFSLGRASGDQDVAAVLEVLPEVVDRARAAGLSGVR
ncbi:cysteine desulfurase family protein [Actinotalea sp. K2]|uniref:cysteine desulfurase family protein n=1 Tax=Actinotalea sp. K2 TaxID=2939438 RepID=UPI002017DD39|nr:cysteine desulfurase family protein [Actinotalea sp. K2]MCL3860482.1 cysteine desulfurase [Actinotalea sp. K2]